MLEEHSRYDEELARLHDKLGHTAIGYGAAAPSVDARARARRRPRRAPSRRRARASWPGTARRVGGKGDLVESIASGSVKLDDVQADLPADMKAMDKTKQAAVIARSRRSATRSTSGSTS